LCNKTAPCCAEELIIPNPVVTVAPSKLEEEACPREENRLTKKVDDFKE
jgi:hypothetical protein